MTNLRIGTITLAIGLAIGGGASTFLRPPAAASGANAMGGMTMKSAPTGDAEMNAVMARMMASMSHAKLTGNQDRDFMIMMIPHHQSAVDMAKIELRRGTRPELKALARDVIASQDREIVRMRGWLDAWYPKTR